MKTITDEAVLAFLLALKDKTTLLDPNGKAIGHFHPLDPQDDELYAQALRFYDNEELDRRKANPRQEVHHRRSVGSARRIEDRRERLIGCSSR